MTTVSKVEARKLKGFRDYLPEAALKRQEIIDHLRHVAAISGFLPIDTPALEYTDVLLGSDGGETEKEVYRFKDHGDRDVALRFDLTVPFSRFVTENYAHLNLPFKRLQVGEVWRGEKPQKGRYRQFAQADLDIIGVDSLLSDVEVISCLGACIGRILGENASFTIKLNNRQILSGLIAKFFPGTDPDTEGKILVIIDKLAKIGAPVVIEQLNNLTNTTAASQLLAALTLDLSQEKNWQQLAELLSASSSGSSELTRFRTTLSLLQETAALGRGRVQVDLSIARGLGYYTGIVFETFVDQLPTFGSISSGGRYNNLVSRFGKHNLAGVGGSIGVDRVLAALEELRLIESKGNAKIFIAIAQDDAVSFAYKLATQLRRAGIACDVGLKPGKLGNQFKYADKQKIPFVVAIGEEEVREQRFRLKEMATGTESPGLDVAALLAKLT